MPKNYHGLRQNKIGFISILLLIGLCLWQSGIAEITPEMARNVASNWLIYYAQTANSPWSKIDNQSIGAESFLTADSDTLAFIFQISPTGYIAVSRYEEMAPLLAFSCSEQLDLRTSIGFINVLRDDLKSRVSLVKAFRTGSAQLADDENGLQAIAINRAKWQLWSLPPSDFKGISSPEISANIEQIGPLLQSRWDQGYPFNKFCPLGNGYNRCVVGCVATATSQIMHFWRWPASGFGNHTYYWSGDGSAPGQDLSADFSDPYDWANMLNSYNVGFSSDQANAVAELCYEVGVAYEMIYGTQASGAYMNQCMEILPQYFGFRNTIVEELRTNHTATSWFTAIQNDLNAYHIIFYGIRNSDQMGHALCCDGWNLSGQTMLIHMNYGWEGSYDNWYQVDHLYSSVYQNDRLYRGIQARSDLAVWPGDADNSGIVDTLDLYALVYYWYQTGIARGEVGFDWGAHQVRFWDNVEATYADCDGSGRVDIRDAFPVCLNWGRTHLVTASTKTPHLDIQQDSVRAVFMEIYQSLENSNSEPAFEIRRYIENLLELPIPSDFELSQNYPNPFNPSTTIQFRLTGKTKVRLAIYDIAGRLARVLVDREEAPGRHQIIWDGQEQNDNPVATGIYFCRMEAFNSSRTRKLTLVR